jgi:hypothetical protein
MSVVAPLMLKSLTNTGVWIRFDSALCKSFAPPRRGNSCTLESEISGCRLLYICEKLKYRGVVCYTYICEKVKYRGAVVCYISVRK